MTRSGRVHHLRPPAAEWSPADLLGLCDDAVREWEKARQPVAFERYKDHRDAALINTFQALSSALQVAGVRADAAVGVFRRLVEASEVLR